MKILTDKQLSRIKSEAHYQGYILGYQMAVSDQTKKGFIASRVSKEVSEILKEKGV